MSIRLVGRVAPCAFVAMAVAIAGWTALLGCTEGGHGVLHKAIVTDGTLYTVHASGSKDRPPEFVSVSLDGQSTMQRFAAPLLNVPALSRSGVAWDVVDGLLIGVSGFELLAPLQHLLQIGKRPLSRLDPMTPKISKAYGYPRGDDVTVAAHPILDGMLEAQLAKSDVFYDLSADDPDRMRLYVLVGGKLRVSEFDGTEWQTLDTATAEFDEPFRVVSRAGTTYVCVESGEIYSLGEASLRRIGRVADRGEASGGGILLIDDRESKQLLFVPLTEGAVQAEAWSLESTGLVRTTVGKSTLAAARAALGHGEQN